MLLFIVSVWRLLISIFFFFYLFIFIYFICFYTSSFIQVKYLTIAKCFFLMLPSKILVTLKGVGRLMVNIIHQSPKRRSLTNMKKKFYTYITGKTRGNTTEASAKYSYNILASFSSVVFLTNVAF